VELGGACVRQIGFARRQGGYAGGRGALFWQAGRGLGVGETLAGARRQAGHGPTVRAPRGWGEPSGATTGLVARTSLLSGRGPEARSFMRPPACRALVAVTRT